MKIRIRLGYVYCENKLKEREGNKSIGYCKAFCITSKRSKHSPKFQYVIPNFADFMSYWYELIYAESPGLKPDSLEEMSSLSKK